MTHDDQPSKRSGEWSHTKRARFTVLTALATMVHASAMYAQATNPDTAPPARGQPGSASPTPTFGPPPELPGTTPVNIPINGPGFGPSMSVITDVLLPNILADTGTHVYELSEQESDDVRAAIERAIAHMNFIARPIARRRLIRANRPSPRLTFEIRPDTLAVTFVGLNPIVTPLSGEAVPWTRGTTGETYAVHVMVAGDTVRQTIADDDGWRENDFVFLDQGATIEMHVTLTADRLPAPLQYVEVFREIRSQPDPTPP